MALLLCALLAAMPMCALAADETAVTVRIEGISETLYCAEVDLPLAAPTAADALEYIDAHLDAIAITGLEAGYITDVNGESAGTFGGWDGWLYRVNGAEPAVGMGECTLAAGDELVLFYSDAYGVGMQFPRIDYAADGVVRFVSDDVAYDEAWDPIATVSPVAGMSVTLSANGASETYVTDADGTIRLSAAQAAGGEFAIAIDKKAENGLPLVLRFAPDATVVVSSTAAQAADSGALVPVLIAAGCAIVLIVVALLIVRRARMTRTGR